MDFPATVCEVLDYRLLIKESDFACICIPVHSGSVDRWTKFLIKFLKSKEKETKGIMALDALENYSTQST